MSLAHRLQPVEEIPHPPAPWKMQGQMWMAFFKTDAPVALPAGLRHVMAPNTLLVILVRYREGTLRYDELAFGTVARRGLRVGVWVDYIWVDSLASVWGGRRIWGLPKNPAEFAWDAAQTQVRVTDTQGPIATLTVNPAPNHSPWLWLPTPGFGLRENGEWVFTIGHFWGQFSRANVQLAEWAPRFTYRPLTPTGTGLAAKPFRLQVPDASVI